MKRIFLLFTLFLALSVSLQAQLLSQTFNSGYNMSLFTNQSITSNGQFNAIAPLAVGSGAGASIQLNGTKKLQFVRSGTTNSYFVRKYLGYNYLQIPAYGALVDVNNALVNKPKTCKNLGIIHQRDQIMLSDASTWPSNMYNLGYKIVLNCNYEAYGSGVPFADSGNYRDALTNMLSSTGIQPALIVVENEEPNGNYHIGWSQDYIKVLTAGTRVAHNFGFKVTNAGLTAEALRYATWKYLSDLSVSGHTQARADLFHSRTTGNTSYNAAWLQKKGLEVDTFVRAYHNIPIDYINFHWYGGDGTIGSQTPVLDEVINYLQEVSGKQAMTNEIGQYNQVPETVDSLLGETKLRNLPFVIWYDSDGTSVSAPAEPLNSLYGALYTNGEHFRDYLANNDLAYLPSRFLSVEFKVNATSVTGGATTSGNTLSLGNGFATDGSATVSDSINASLSLLFGSTSGFKLKENTNGTTSALYTAEQTFRWYVNNSGSTVGYTTPGGGSTETLATGKFDVWVKPSAGTTWTRLFNEVPALHAAVWLADLQFQFTDGTGTLQFDDITVTDQPNNPVAFHATPEAETLSSDESAALRVVPGRGSLQVTVNAPEAGPGTVFLYDLAGNRLQQQDRKMVAGQNTFTLAAPATHGAYMVSVIQNGTRMTRKFVW